MDTWKNSPNLPIKKKKNTRWFWKLFRFGKPRFRLGHLKLSSDSVSGLRFCILEHAPRCCCWLRTTLQAARDWGVEGVGGCECEWKNGRLSLNSAKGCARNLWPQRDLIYMSLRSLFQGRDWDFVISPSLAPKPSLSILGAQSMGFELNKYHDVLRVQAVEPVEGETLL